MMAEMMNDKIEDLKEQGHKPCPNCGAYFNPANTNEKDRRCSNCGADVSLSPEEAAAVRLSDAELAVQLTALRKKAKIMKTIAFICVGGFIIGAIISVWVFAVLAIIAAAVFAIISAIASSKAKTLLANNITRDMFSQVFDECVYTAKSRLPDQLLREAALIPRWDMAAGSDLVSAKYKGHTVNFSDIELSEKVETTNSDGDTSTSYETRFKGQWMVLELGRKVPDKLRLRENSERFGKISKKILGERSKNKSDVQTENEAFNKRFQILTEDAHNAFYILTPHFMEFIMRADDAANTNTDLCFFENRVHIACHTGRDSFELQKNDGANLEQIRMRMKNELAYITSIADELLKNEYLFGGSNEGSMS